MASDTRELHIPGLSGGGLQGFADHLNALSSYYLEGEDSQYIRAVALLWAGVSYDRDFAGGTANIAIRNILRLLDIGEVHLTPLPLLFEGDAGWNRAYLDDTNPSHHYALFLAAGYFDGYTMARAVNHLRDANNPPDLLVGDVAAMHGSRLWHSAGAFRQLGSWLRVAFP